MAIWLGSWESETLAEGGFVEVADALRLSKRQGRASEIGSKGVCAIKVGHC